VLGLVSLDFVCTKFLNMHCCCAFPFTLAGLFLFVLSHEQLTSCRWLVRMAEIFATAEDTEIDVPRIWQYLAQVVSPMVQPDGALPLSFLGRATESVRLSRKVSLLIADILHSAASRLVCQSTFV